MVCQVVEEAQSSSPVFFDICLAGNTVPPEEDEQSKKSEQAKRYLNIENY